MLKVQAIHFSSVIIFIEVHYGIERVRLIMQTIVSDTYNWLSPKNGTLYKTFLSLTIINVMQYPNIISKQSV